MENRTIKMGIVTSMLLMGSTVLMAGGEIEPMAPMVNTDAPAKVEWKSKHKFFGFSQIGAVMGDGGTNDDTDVAFEADRIRLGWKYFSGPLAGKVFLDFAKDGSGSIEVPNIIKDAFISYKFDDAAILKAGVIKTPVGMGFTIPGWNLDVIKRGFDKGLAFERATGLMLSGRDIGFGNNGKVDGLEMGHERPWKGFGYDIMIAGATGRSKAVKDPVKLKGNQGNAYMGRIMFDWGQELHLEAGYGINENADGDNTTATGEDYKVLNLGLDSHFSGYNFKAEYYDVSGIQGADIDRNTLALTGTYYITDTIEFAVKHIMGETDNAGVETDGSNTYLGLNYYINPKNNKMSRKARRGRNRHRIQLNYVVAGGDKENFDNTGGGKYYQDDVILAQYQFKF